MPVTGSLIVSQLTRPMMRVGEIDDFVVAFVDRADDDAVDRAAIIFVDDHVLRRVDELAGEVAGVRGLERGIGKTLAGAVRGDEVFQHGETFAEVRNDRALDDFAGGLGHEAAHAGELLDLVAVTARAGIDHEEHGVEFLAAIVVLEGAEHDVGDFFAGVGPDVDDLVVALAVGDGAGAVLLLDHGDLLVGVARSTFAFSFGMIMSLMPMEMPAWSPRRSRVPSAVERLDGRLRGRPTW